MNKRWLIGVLALLSAALADGAGRPQESSVAGAPAPAAYRAVIDQYCTGCHNEKLKTAGLMLDKMDLGHVAEHADVWEKVIRKLRAGAMPPLGRPQPGKDKSDSLAAWLESELDHAATASPNPGNPAIHRLNRVEYANS